MTLGQDFRRYLNQLEENEIERYINQEHINQGKVTNLFNKITSNFCVLLLILVAVQFFKDAQYLPMFILIILANTKLGNLVIIGLIIYALITRYWSVLTVLSVYMVLSYLGYYFEKKRIRLLLRERKPIIDTFEGMVDFAIILPLQLISFALALLFSGTLSIIMWIIFSIMLLYYLARCFYRSYPCYNQVHQPMMFRYAKIAAEEHLKAQKEGEEFDFSRAAKSLLETVVSTDEAQKIFQRAETRMKTFSDYHAFEAALAKVRTKSKLSANISEFLNKVRNHITTQEAQKYIINYCIAEIIEAIFGSKERILYLLHSFLGKVR